MAVYEQRHPLIQHKIGLLRAKRPVPSNVASWWRRLPGLLTYEATRDCRWSQPRSRPGAARSRLSNCRAKTGVVPILRAGLGMLTALDVIPCAKISVIGMSRNEATLQPRLYVSKLVPHIEQRRALLVDPMLATGGSLFAVIRLLKQAGCQHIPRHGTGGGAGRDCALEQQYPDVDVYGGNRQPSGRQRLSSFPASAMPATGSWARSRKLTGINGLPSTSNVW